MRFHSFCLLVALPLLMLGGCNTEPAPIPAKDLSPYAAIHAAKDAKILTEADRIDQKVAGLPVAPAVAESTAAQRAAIAAAPAADVAELVAQNNELRAIAGRLQADGAALQKQFDAFKIEAAEALHAAKAETEREAYLAVVKVFAALGAACTAAGLLVFLWSTYKRAGILLVIAGPVIGGSGLLWGKPWFYLSVGLGALLVGVVIGIRYVWTVIESKTAAASATSTASTAST